ncbi:hypothetical protein K469DRAFT_782652 [Zopfia rhizophila CBS 207.26]|uniref:Uncharacterized protein n=1 Tax=Zopfia rhizophila CBS 207.26 TaxID=1314779 RepID=A0A6A6ETK7_9PEZI|nr:hypothetical protein K469DRAFT_782652 [Zopfia rhizophila CBS 207.26]
MTIGGSTGDDRKERIVRRGSTGELSIQAMVLPERPALGYNICSERRISHDSVIEFPRFSKMSLPAERMSRAHASFCNLLERIGHSGAKTVNIILVCFGVEDKVAIESNAVKYDIIIETEVAVDMLDTRTSDCRNLIMDWNTCRSSS